MKGIVKWYDAKKGFGFVETTDEGDLFIHRSFILEGVDLYTGDKVVFNIEKTEKKRPNAINIKKIS